MTDADLKRQAIEALLCAGGDDNNVSLNEALMNADYNGSVARFAVDETYLDCPAATKMRFGDRLAEAAYRLIESSSVLRREWFGAP